jgi:mannose-1-phosphate guanylyltransferase
VEPEPLDTAGAIRFAALDAGIDERFVVLNGDVITDLDIGALIAFHDAHGGEGTIALHQVEDPSAFGVVPTDADGRVEAFVEKPPRDEAPTDLINAGTYILEPAVLDRIEPGRKVSIEREVFPAMVEDGVLYALDGDTYWIDTGIPANYIKAQLDLLDGVRGPAAVGVSAGAVIAADAVVQRSVVPEGAVVEAGARVVDSVLFHGAHVGAGATVEHSILGASAKVGEGAVVTDLSVVGDGEVVNPGEVLKGTRRPAPDA